MIITFSKQTELWRDGEQYRTKLGLKSPIKHTEGIYSVNKDGQNMPKQLSNDNVSGILGKVDIMNINDSDEKEVTQGGMLNQRKALHGKNKPLSIPVYVL